MNIQVILCNLRPYFFVENDFFKLTPPLKCGKFHTFLKPSLREGFKKSGKFHPRVGGGWGFSRVIFHFLIFFIILSFFLGFSMVKIYFFQKVLKKWSSFRKKSLIFFQFQGGSRPKSGIFHFLKSSFNQGFLERLNRR